MGPYYSKIDTIKDDWIIFWLISNESVCYIPTMLKLEVHETSGESPKDFNIYIGDANKNEWIKCNDTTLIGLQKQWQEFTLFSGIIRIYDSCSNQWMYKDKTFVLTHGFIRSYSDDVPDDIASMCLAYAGGDKSNKIKAIIENKYKHFKWEILTNHGSEYYISARQFIL